MQQRVAADQARLARVETRLRQLTLEETMSDYDVRLKKVEPLLVASIRDTIPDWEQVTPTFNRLFDEVYAYAQSRGAVLAGPALDLWHHEGRPSGNEMPVEAAAPLAAPILESARVQVYHLLAVETMASTIHQGTFVRIGQAHEAVVRWTQTNGYQISGPSREIYLQYEREGNPNDYLTEIQYPVTKF
jgi:effector-binding domain-containing protein